jgi:cellulose synthase/poly-beta-1,6-N-acetylglucosamine synthase-like glycosyltransferase
MFFLLAWTLIGGATFLGLFYLNIYWNQEREEVPELDSQPRVSILMPAYNEEGKIQESLENALNMEYPVDVIVVDDGSTDSTLEKAREFSDAENIEIIEHEENRGKAEAMNTGLEYVDTEYVAVQDADSAASAELLEKAVARFESDKSLGSVIGAIQNFQSDTLVRKLQRVQYQMTNFYRSLMASIGTLDVTPGAFSLYRTTDLREVGGFDPGNPTEDLEMAWRLRHQGKGLDMVFSSESKTEFPEDLKSLYNQRVRWKRGSIINLVKYREMFFNKKYGWFGRLQLPLHTVSPLIAAASLLLVIVGLSESLFNLAVSASAIGFIMPDLQSLNLMSMVLNVQYKIYVPLFIGMIVSGVMIRTAYREGGKKVENPVALGIYFLWFFAFQGFFTLSAILKEMLKTERVWR